MGGKNIRGPNFDNIAKIREGYKIKKNVNLTSEYNVKFWKFQNVGTLGSK